MIVTIICDGGDCSGGEYSGIVVVVNVVEYSLKNLLGNLLFCSVLQVLLNRETWRTCLVLVFGAKEHHSENLENLFRLLKDGKLGTQTSFSSNFLTCTTVSTVNRLEGHKSSVALHLLSLLSSSGVGAMELVAMDMKVSKFCCYIQTAIILYCQ